MSCVAKQFKVLQINIVPLYWQIKYRLFKRYFTSICCAIQALHPAWEQKNSCGISKWLGFALCSYSWASARLALEKKPVSICQHQGQTKQNCCHYSWQQMSLHSFKMSLKWIVSMKTQFYSFLDWNGPNIFAVLYQRWKVESALFDILFFLQMCVSSVNICVYSIRSRVWVVIWLHVIRIT